MNKVKLVLTMLVVLVTTGSISAADNKCANGHTCDANGFCTTSGCAAKYAYPDGDGTTANPFLIANGGNLFWFAERVNSNESGTSGYSKHAKLSENIDLGGKSHPFTPIGVGTSKANFFSGVFNGNGKTISNLYIETSDAYVSWALFGAISGSTLSNFSVSGEIIVKELAKTRYSNVAGVVGNAGDNSRVEGISSSVDITFTKDCSSQLGVDNRDTGIGRRVGGIVSSSYTKDHSIFTNESITIDRCHYSGSITAGKGCNDCIGGIVSVLFGDKSSVSNCLFDGALSSAFTQNTEHYAPRLAGIVGYSSSVITVNGNVSAGTMSGGWVAQSGALFGNITKANCLIYKNYFDSSKNSVPYGLFSAQTVSGLGLTTAELIGTSLESTLGTENWTYTTGKLPVPRMDAGGIACTHTDLSHNGFCQCRYAYEKPEGSGTQASPYLIKNAGNLYWFANEINLGSSSTGMFVELADDIDLFGVALPRIGISGKRFFTGSFDGKGKTISGLNMQFLASDEQKGLFGYMKGATIKDFTLKGKISAVAGTYLGSVVGLAEGGLIEDVHSSVQMNVTGANKITGGIVGRMYGTVNRCRFDGTITVDTSVDRIAGIVGDVGSVKLTLTNNLFDGTIELKATSGTPNVGGILAKYNGGANHVFERNLSMGTIKLASGLAITNSALLVGNHNKQIASYKCNYYISNNTPNLGAVIKGDLSNASYGYEGGYLYAGGIAKSELCKRLMEQNWTADCSEGYPIPRRGGDGTHTCEMEGNVCMAYETVYEGPMKNGDTYLIWNCADMLWLSKQVNAATSAFTNNAKVMQDINMFKVPLTRIGYDATHTFAATFDGQGYTIKNYYLFGNSNDTGMFGLLNSSAVIKNFTLIGKMEMNGGDHVGAIVGTGLGCKIEDIHSSVNISQTSDKQNIGGIAGKFYGTIERCRFDGSIETVNAYKNIGGIVGNARDGKMTAKACLFDGTINVKRTGVIPIVGGILGYVETENGGHLVERCLSHGSITLASGVSVQSTGLLFGRPKDSGVHIKLNRNYYTTAKTSSTANAVGMLVGVQPADAGCYLAKEVKFPDDFAAKKMLPKLEVADWKQDDADAYPVPHHGTAVAHTHTFVNGFCTADDGGVEEAELEGDCYVIKNGGQLVWFSNFVNGDGSVTENTPVMVNAKLEPTDDKGNKTSVIDLEDRSFTKIGEQNKRFFHGTFDGQGHTINGFNLKTNANNAGLFAYLENGSTVKNFHLDGTMTATYGTNVGSVVGLCNGAIFEDVWSSVNLTFTAASVSNGKNRLVGGIAGNYSGDMNRCRYSGTLTCTNVFDVIGGVVGILNKQSYSNSTLRNCLFDGTLKVNGVNESLIAGGLFGRCGGDDTYHVQHCFSHGTISLDANVTKTKSGVLLGYTYNQPLIMTSNYYTTDNKSGLNCIGDNTGAIFDYDAVTEVTDLADLKNNVLLGKLGDGNWKQGDACPIPYHNASGHTHKFDSNGFCLANDGGYEQPAEDDEAEIDGDVCYVIKNGGNLFWLSDYVNKTKKYNEQVFAYLANDINLENRRFNRIGYSDDHALDGEFDGRGHTISGLYMYSKVDSTGLFGYIRMNTTLKNFTLKGSMTQADGGNVGSVVGYCNGGTIEDVFSYVDITMNKKKSNVAGIAGRFVGKMNRCRYRGNLTSVAYQGIAGIIGNVSANSTVSNCLFDGSLTVNSTNAGLCLGGIIGKISDVTLTVDHCFSHGSVTLPANATTVQSGCMVGFSSGKAKVTIVNDYFTGVAILGNKDIGSKLGTYYGNCSEVTNMSDLTDGTLLMSLSEVNWIDDTSLGYPIPRLGGGGVHEHDNHLRNGFCIANDGYYQEPALVSGTYEISNGGNLYWFANKVNTHKSDADTKYPGDEMNIKAVLKKTIDLEDGKYGSFPGIGYEKTCADGKKHGGYGGTFDGQGNAIKNMQIRSAATSTGLFGVLAAGAVVKDFTLTGKMEMTGGSNIGTVVGYAQDNATIEDVYSSVTLQHSADNKSIGGIAGKFRGTIERCRYDGLMNLPESYQYIGGIVGEVNQNINVTNCLFDGEMYVPKANTKLFVGGIIGYVTAGDKNTLENSLSHGKITLTDDTNVTGKSGILLGFVASGKKIAIKNNYYTKFNVTNLNNERGNSDGTVTVTSASIEVTELPYKKQGNSLQWWLGDTNWAQASDAKYPFPLKGGGVHVHSCVNGFCLRGDGYEEPTLTNGSYIIDNGGKLYWFAEHVNQSYYSSKKNPNPGAEVRANATLANDIDLENGAHGSFPGIGYYYEPKVGQQKKTGYAGTFDGAGFTIRNFSVSNCSEDYNGLFQYTEGATIKNFVLEGSMTIDKNTEQHGSVIGWEGTGTTLEDVHSKVNINCDNNASVIGGLVGRVGGTVNRCRYSGSIVAEATVKDRIGGIAGDIFNGTLSNCLFDGYINAKNAETNLSVAGIACASSGTSSAVKNCLMKGTLNFDILQTPNKSGVVAGYTTSGSKFTFSDTYFVRAGVNVEATKLGTVSTSGTFIGSATLIALNQNSDVNQLLNGEACALLNANDGQWSQILGYQDTGNTPAQAMPLPHDPTDARNSKENDPDFKGYYPVTKDANGAYMIGCYFFDDNGEATPMPSGDPMLSAKRIVYNRTNMPAGYISVCVPFELTSETMPSIGSYVILKYKDVPKGAGMNIQFTRVKENTVDGGVPCFLYLGKTGVAWDIDHYRSDGHKLVTKVDNPEYGIKGSFETIETGAWSVNNQLYKLNGTGTSLVQTTAKSHCYPYRCYLRLHEPEVNEVKSMGIVYDFDEEEEEADGVEPATMAEENTSDAVYNLLGQQVSSKAKGIVIKNGKKVFVK